MGEMNFNMKNNGKANRLSTITHSEYYTTDSIYSYDQSNANPDDPNARKNCRLLVVDSPYYQAIMKRKIIGGSDYNKLKSAYNGGFTHAKLTGGK